jgi:hypothetical protein
MEQYCRQVYAVCIDLTAATVAVVDQPLRRAAYDDGFAARCQSQVSVQTVASGPPNHAPSEQINDAKKHWGEV